MSAVDDLKSILGPQGWLEAPTDTESFRTDWRRKHIGEALMVTRPNSVDQVQEVVRICNRHEIAIVPQGGNSSLTGASVPNNPRPTIVLSLGRLNKVRSICPEGYSMTVDAGCIIQNIQEAAREVDRTLGLDFGARGTAVIGGAIGTNAGGLNVVRYGPCRDQVLGLEMVLADGTLIDNLSALRKDNSGYPLKHLFIGAEGTLGIVTAATLKLWPNPKHHTTAFVALNEKKKALDLLSMAKAEAHDVLDAFELVTEMGLSRSIEKTGVVRRPFETVRDWYILTRFAGTEPVEERLERFLEHALEAGIIDDGAIAQSGGLEEELWAMRDEHLSPRVLFGSGDQKFDTAVPVEHVADYLITLEKETCAIDKDLHPYALGHIGDGSLHFHIMQGETMSDTRYQELCPITEKMVMNVTFSFGGTISGEHGIGIDQRHRLGGQKSPAELALMRQIKSVFDPKGIMNPGKLFPEPSLHVAA